jgi:EEF1A lysine methyltransferase 4
LIEGVEDEVSQIGGRYFPSKENCRVLNVGCGNSLLGEHMLRDGYKDIVNVDYSTVVINKLKEKYTPNFFVDLKESLDRGMRLKNQLGLVDTRDDHASESNNVAPMPKMTFEVVDATLYIPHPDERFDLIICKKTLDMILCSEGSIASAKQMMAECFRLLKKDHGVMIILSSAKPEDRAFFFEQNAWSGVENIRLPSKEDGGQYWDQRRGHERKTIQSYAYILYK